MPSLETDRPDRPATPPEPPSSAGPPDLPAAARWSALGAPSPDATPRLASGARLESPTELASLGDRALAIALDTLVPLAAFIGAGLWIAPAAGGMTASGFKLEGTPALIVMACALAAALVYQIGFEGLTGTSLGKVVAGIRVTTIDGQPIGLRAATVRNLMRFVDGLGVYLVAALSVLLTRRRQRLGDLAAGTVVVCRDYGRVLRVLALLALVALPIASFGVLLSRSRAQDAAATSPTPSTSAAGPAAPPVSPAASAARAAALPPDPVSDGPFSASGFRLAAGKNGPDRPDATFRPQEQVALLFEVQGHASRDGGRGRLQLAYRVLDPEGVAMAEDSGTESEVPAGPGTAANVWVTVSVPAFALPGTHRLEVDVTDLESGRHVAVARPFTVQALPFQPSDTLVLRHVRLTEGEDGPPRRGSAYPSGSHVWIAFEIVGFKVGEGGTVKISQDLEVVAKDGTRILQDHVLDIDQRFSYVPRRLPGSNHISLGEIPAGDYEARLSFSDRIGGGAWTEVVPFSVHR
jgi:uncharacterized RDD family membrane protein YckC